MYVPVILALGTVPVFRLEALIFPIKEGAVIVPEKLPVVAPVIAPLTFSVPSKLCPHIVLAV